MTIKEALNKASKELQNGKEARILLSHYLEINPLALIIKENEEVPSCEKFFTLIERAKRDEPIEYITNEVSFYARDFFIQAGALIPRPETEILVDKTVEIAKNIQNPSIAEIGVGSGIISIMIALLVDDVHITATDISKDALDIAEINAKRFGVEDKITFIHTPYLIVNPDNKFDIIVSNPPYVADEAKVKKNLSYEPDIALFGGEVGDEILKNIIDIAAYHDNCILCCEMGYDQKKPLSNYIQSKGLKKADFYQDLSGFDRGFTLTLGDNHRR